MIYHLSINHMSVQKIWNIFRLIWFMKSYTHIFYWKLSLIKVKFFTKVTWFKLISWYVIVFIILSIASSGIAQKVIFIFCYPSCLNSSALSLLTYFVPPMLLEAILPTLTHPTSTPQLIQEGVLNIFTPKCVSAHLKSYVKYRITTYYFHYHSNFLYTWRLEKISLDCT